MNIGTVTIVETEYGWVIFEDATEDAMWLGSWPTLDFACENVSQCADYYSDRREGAVS
jgi:hypothetical protein